MKKLATKFLAVVSALVAFTLLATPAFAQTYSYGTTSTAGDAAAGVFGLGLSFGYLFCICCIPLLILLTIAYFIYKDAVKNKVENPWLWALLSMTLVGLLIYLLAIRPDAIKAMEKGHSESKE